MPIYEYHCDSCQESFEALVMGGQAPEQCERCGASTIHRILSACGFISKGGGGETVSRSAGSSGCAGCTSGSCASCG